MRASAWQYIAALQRLGAQTSAFLSEHRAPRTFSAPWVTTRVTSPGSSGQRGSLGSNKHRPPTLRILARLDAPGRGRCSRRNVQRAWHGCSAARPVPAVAEEAVDSGGGHKLLPDFSLKGHGPGHSSRSI